MLLVLLKVLCVHSLMKQMKAVLMHKWDSGGAWVVLLVLSLAACWNILRTSTHGYLDRVNFFMHIHTCFHAF